MNTFQILGLAVAGFFALLSLAAMLRHRLSPRSGIGWTLLWLAAGAAIVEPEATAVAARALGITRGADLVVYCAILGMFVGFFLVFARLRRIEDDLTRLTRHIALSQAAEPQAPAPRSDPEELADEPRTAAG